MGILNWFMDRPRHFEAERLSDEMLEKAIDKAVVLTNPRLKLLPDYRHRLAAPVRRTVDYLRERMLSLSSAIAVSSANWSAEPVLRAFFANAQDIPRALAASGSLRTLFAKYPSLDEAHFVLGMIYQERHVEGMGLSGEQARPDISRKIISFSTPWIRICGQNEVEVKHLLGGQSFEYLVAQSLIGIGELRTGRQELEDHRSLIRARLRILQQQGPGLGSVFAAAPGRSVEQYRLEAELLENERRLEAQGNSREILEAELECLCQVFASPQRYLSFEDRRMRLSSLNEVLTEDSLAVGAEVDFTLATLSGEPQMTRAFFLARMARSDMPAAKVDFAGAERLL